MPLNFNIECLPNSNTAHIKEHPIITIWTQNLICKASITTLNISNHIDVNECENDMGFSHTNATCANTNNSFTCTCSEGYTGNGINCSGQ